jgi:hypothetical protein
MQGNEVRRKSIVNYFRIKFFEDACVLPIIGHCNREFMNNAGKTQKPEQAMFIFFKNLIMSAV